MIEARGVSYQAQTESGWKELLHDVSFRSTGDRLVIIGPNGSGKSTLLKVLGGLLPSRSGQVLLGGRPRSVAPAYLPQRPEEGLWLELTVRESLTVAASRGSLTWPGFASWAKVQEGLPWLPGLLRDRLDVKVESLSGGEQQVLLLACALGAAHGNGDGDLCLLADELTASLDPAHEALARVALHEAVRTTLRKGHLVLVTHSWADVREFATDVLALRRGTVNWCLPAERVEAERFLAAYELDSAEAERTDAVARKLERS